MLGRIRDEGLNRSQVMDHVSWLSDVYGPRLTGSPGIQQASEWAMKTFTRVGTGQRRTRSGGRSARAGRWCGSPRTSSSRRCSRSIGFPQEWSSGTKGPGHRRRRPRADRQRSRLREVPRQARRQDRADAAGARGAHARRPDHPADDRQGHRGSRDDAGAGAAAGGGRGGTCGGGVPPEARRISTSQERRRRRSSIAAATATWPRAAAICRGSSSIPTAARSSRTARARATTRPARACR